MKKMKRQRRCQIKGNQKEELIQKYFRKECNASFFYDKSLKLILYLITR